MTIKQNGGIFGRNPSFKSIELDGTDLETTLDAKADLAGDTFTGQVNINTPTTGGLTVTAAGNGEIVASRTSGASVKIQSQSARGLIGTTSNHGFRLMANSAQYVDLSTSGNLEVMSGNLVIGTSGKGIDFSATSGTGTSELFDDYEEGTWTPTLLTGTATAADALYTKIGNMVYATATLSSFSDRSTASNVVVSSLPYAPAVNTSGGSMFSRYTAVVTPVPYLTTGGYVTFYGNSSGDYVQLQHSNLSASASAAISFNIVYRA